MGIPIWEHAKCALVDTKANARMNILFCGLEPSVAGSLKLNCKHKKSGERSENPDLLEDVMEKNVVAIIVHDPC